MASHSTPLSAALPAHTGMAAALSPPRKPSIEKNIHTMKYTLIATLALATLCTSCQRALPPVPDNGRVVVQPKGSTDIVKPWNGTTRQEGDAVLGPLSNARR